MRTLLAAIVILQTTGLPAMLQPEAHDHSRCICQLSKKSCRQKRITAGEQVILDSKTTYLCNCADEKQQATQLQNFANLPEPFRLPAEIILKQYLPGTPQLDLPSPVYQIWSPPS